MRRGSQAPRRGVTADALQGSYKPRDIPDCHPGNTLRTQGKEVTGSSHRFSCSLHFSPSRCHYDVALLYNLKLTNIKVAGSFSLELAKYLQRLIM